MYQPQGVSGDNHLCNILDHSAVQSTTFTSSSLVDAKSQQPSSDHFTLHFIYFPLNSFCLNHLIWFHPSARFDFPLFTSKSSEYLSIWPLTQSHFGQNLTFLSKSHRISFTHKSSFLIRMFIYKDYYWFQRDLIGCFLKVLYIKFSYKRSPKYLVSFGILEKYSLSKNCCGTFLCNYLKNWATFIPTSGPIEWYTPLTILAS